MIDSEQQAREAFLDDHQVQSLRPHQVHNNTCLRAAFSHGVDWARGRQVHVRPCTCNYCNSGDGYNCKYRRRGGPSQT